MEQLQLQRLTPSMVKDAVFWVILSIYQGEFYPKEFQASRRWLAMGVKLSTDHLIPDAQRISCVSILYEANRWGEFRRAIDVGLSVLPFSIDMKERLKWIFNDRVEDQLIVTIQDYVTNLEQSSADPLFYWDMDSESSSSEDTNEHPFSWNRPSSASSSHVYTGSSANLSARQQYRRPIRSSDHHARRQLQAALAMARLATSPHLSDPSFRPRVIEDVANTSESELVQNLEPSLNTPHI